MKIGDQLYKKLAEKYNLPEKQIEEICRSLTEFTLDVIERGDREPVRWPYFGVFSCKPRRVLELQKLNLL